MPDNSYVQVSPDSTGKKIRNLEVTTLQGDGSLATVEMQVVSITDKQGVPVDLGNLEGLLERLNDNIEELLFEIQLQNESSPE